MSVEQTLVILKPQAVQTSHVGEILSRYERRGLILREMNLMVMSQAQAQQLYAPLKQKPFYDELVGHMTSGPVVVCALESISCVAACRQINGATDPLQAAPGSIRGDFALTVDDNVVHASDSAARAREEILIFFPNFKFA